MEEGSENTQETKKKGSFLLKLIPYLIVLGIGVYGGTYLVRQKPTWFGLPQGTAQAQAEVNALVAKVSKLMVLPTDETPTVATVTDASKIKDQPFFADAQNGDKVLIYQKTGEAILFRESDNKIIKFGAVNFNQPTETSSPETQTSASPKAKATATPVASTEPTATPAQ